MIQIQKGVEPTEWTEKRKTPGFTRYEPIPELRVALLKEQGYICAFCMRRIPVKDQRVKETSKIAHLLSREKHHDQQTNFKNIVASCPGAIDDDDHCDRSQKSENVTLPLFDPALQRSISYGSHTGEVRSSVPDWDKQMREILNLNNERLKRTRKLTLEGVIHFLNHGEWKRGQIQAKLKEWSGMDNGRLKPYCGIVIWYLEKKLHQLS